MKTLTPSGHAPLTLTLSPRERVEREKRGGAALHQGRS